MSATTTTTHNEKAELERRLNDIKQKERDDYFARAEAVWSTYLLPLLLHSRQKYPRGQGAPILLTLQHRAGAYRSGLQGGGVWILHWNTYAKYINCSGDAEPESFGFESIDVLFPTPKHIEAFQTSLPNMGVEFTIQLGALVHPSLAAIKKQCFQIQQSCRSLTIEGETIYPKEVSAIDWEKIKARRSFSTCIINKKLLRAQIKELSDLVDAIPTAAAAADDETHDIDNDETTTSVRSSKRTKRATRD